jgi:hypothetical protein
MKWKLQTWVCTALQNTTQPATSGDESRAVNGPCFLLLLGFMFEFFNPKAINQNMDS